MTEIAVYDRTGEPRTVDWLRDRYGPFIIYPAVPPADGGTLLAWKLTALREKNDAAFVARARGADRQPVPGVRVCFYWPDAPLLPGAGPLGAPYDGIKPDRAVSGYTNAGGETGFGMGSGAHYDPASGERGPHAAWVCGAGTRSDVLLGIGMIRDDHLHFDAEWSLVEDAGEDGDGEPGELLEQFAAAVEQLRRIAGALEAMVHG